MNLLRDERGLETVEVAILAGVVVGFAAMLAVIGVWVYRRLAHLPGAH